MLDYIRSSTQSFGIKAAFGIIILVFVFWGVGNFNDRDYSNVVAVVNGEPIVATEFERAYQNAEEYILRNNPGMTREQLIKDHLGRQVLRDLIQETALVQEAQKNGIVVTPVELRHEVGKIEAFQDASGKFDPEAYKRVLAARRMSPGQYEKELSNQILQNKIFGMVSAGAWVSPDEALNFYNYLREKRVVSYLFTPAKDYLGQATASDADVTGWYEAHKNEFAIPAKVDVSYIEVRPEDLIDKKTITDKAALAWYEANKNRFETQERINVAHILVPVPEDADEQTLKEAQEKIAKAKAEIDAGKPFAKVADEYNPKGAAGSGGELGWILRGQTVPKFEEIAFALEPGVLSDVTRTPFGLHLIAVHEKVPAGVRPFNEVKDEVIKNIAADEGADKIHEVLDNLIEDNILNKSMKESAAKYGLQEGQTGLLDKAKLMAKLGISDEAAQTLMGVAPGSPMDTALDAGDKYIVARVISATPAGFKPFDEVKTEAEKGVKEQKAMELALAGATTLLEKIKNMPRDTLREEYKNVKTSEPIERGSTLPGFAPDQALDEAIFEAKNGSWLDKAWTESFDGQPGALLLRVDEVMLPEDNGFADVSEILANSAKRARIQELFELFMQNVLARAKVEITNQNFIDRVGG